MKPSGETRYSIRKYAKNIVLIGSTGSGKTSVGYQLAKLLGYGVFDIDDRIVSRYKKDIASIFKDQGEQGFRACESTIIEELAAIRNHVVISGGGAVESDANWQILRSLGPTVWLATPVAEVARRFLNSPDALSKRPMLQSCLVGLDGDQAKLALQERLEELMQARMHRYKEADHEVVCSFATVETCALLIKHSIEQAARQYNDGQKAQKRQEDSDTPEDDDGG